LYSSSQRIGLPENNSNAKLDVQANSYPGALRALFDHHGRRDLFGLLLKGVNFPTQSSCHISEISVS
jgi:hypothetical protein